MKKLRLLLLISAFALLSASCVSTHQSLVSSKPEIQLKPENLEITEPMEAMATTIRVFGIDWERLLGGRTASISRGSVYSTIAVFDATDQYALYNLLKQNPGYDMILYPQFTTVKRKPFLGLGLIYSVTEVKVSARMAKLKI